MKVFRQKDVISQQILSDLFDGKLHTEGKLPPASEISKSYGISIVTMREILKSMENLGILSVNHGKGIFLNNPDTIFLELFDMRIILESSIAGLAAENRAESDIKKLENILSDLKEASLTKNIQLYTDLDHDFHFCIASICRNIILKTTMVNIRNFLHYQQPRTNISMQPKFNISFEEHHLILEKIIEKDCLGAEQAMKDHLVKAKKLWISRK